MSDGEPTSPMDPTAAGSGGGDPAPEPEPGDPDRTRPLDPPDDPARTGPAGPGAPGPEPVRCGPWRLRRSIGDRRLKGVAGGIAAAADVDPTLVRLLFALSALWGFGLVAYLVLALALQDETVEDRARALPPEPQRVLRIGLAVVAAISVLRLFDGWLLGFGGGDLALPLVLIAAGAAVLWARRDVQPQPAGLRQPGAPDPFAPAGQTGGGGVGGPPPPPWPVAPPPGPSGGVSRSTTGRDVVLLVAAFVAVGAFLAFLGGAFLVVFGAVPMRLPFLPGALGLAALIGLVVSVSRRSVMPGLLVSGGALLLAALLAVGLSSLPGGASSRTIAIGPGTPLADRYDQSAGRLLLDLSRLPLAAGESRRVAAKVGLGQLTVIVPPTVTTDVEADVGAGEAHLFGRHHNGARFEASAHHPGIEGRGRLQLDLDVGAGKVNVVLAEEPTFRVACQVPVDALAASGPVTCPHPPQLASTAMACSVVLTDPDGLATGNGFCRRLGAKPPPMAGSFASACTVPSDSDQATCTGLDAGQLEMLQGINRHGTAAPPATGPGPAPPSAPRSPLACGPPDAAGVRTCTEAPASSSTTTRAATFRCTEDPATAQLTCVPA